MAQDRKAGDAVTYYVVVPFLDSEDGPVPGDAREAPSAEAARRQAASIVGGEVIGALAFSRTGSLAEGVFEDAVALAAVGRVDVSALESGQ